MITCHLCQEESDHLIKCERCNNLTCPDCFYEQFNTCSECFEDNVCRNTDDNQRLTLPVGTYLDNKYDDMNFESMFDTSNERINKHQGSKWDYDEEMFDIPEHTVEIEKSDLKRLLDLASEKVKSDYDLLEKLKNEM